jgi:hypothetical protein
MKREACESEQNMRMKVPITQQPVEAQTQPPDTQRRINAGWLRLWRAAFPNTPPPVEGGRRKTEVTGQKSERRRAAVGYLARFLCAGLAVGLLVAGCAGSRITFSKVGQVSRLPQNHLAAKLPAAEPQPPRQARHLPYFGKHFRCAEFGRRCRLRAPLQEHTHTKKGINV